MTDVKATDRHNYQNHVFGHICKTLVVDYFYSSYNFPHNVYGKIIKSFINILGGRNIVDVILFGKFFLTLISFTI